MNRQGTPAPIGHEALARLREKFFRLRVPVSGSLDLTARCNLRCLHCYLGEAGSSPQNELGTPEIMALIDHLAEAGCLDLLLTGGEPLLHPDFPEIYIRAKEAGMLVTIFTNGTLVDEETIRLFRDLPPLSVEVSVYGASRETFEAVTGVPGSYHRCMNGIALLRAADLELTLKTVIMTINRHELAAMRELAARLGTAFRVDPAIFPRLNGDRAPLQLRLPAEEAVALEFADVENARRWRTFHAETTLLPPLGTLYECDAGVTGFHIRADGTLVPCLMALEPAYALGKGSFEEGWRQLTEAMAGKRPTESYPCPSCERQLICGSCPGFFRLENGSEEAISDYLCELGAHRLEAILQHT